MASEYLKKVSSLKKLDGINNTCEIIDYTSGGRFWKYLVSIIAVKYPLEILDDIRKQILNNSELIYYKKNNFFMI